MNKDVNDSLGLTGRGSVKDQVIAYVEKHMKEMERRIN
jgi:hypothetical protein